MLSERPFTHGRPYVPQKRSRSRRGAAAARGAAQVANCRRRLRAYARPLLASSGPCIFGVMPENVGWLWSGRIAPPLAENRSNTGRIASVAEVSRPPGFAEI